MSGRIVTRGDKRSGIEGKVKQNVAGMRHREEPPQVIAYLEGGKRGKELDEKLIGGGGTMSGRRKECKL